MRFQYFLAITYPPWKFSRVVQSAIILFRAGNYKTANFQVPIRGFPSLSALTGAATVTAPVPVDNKGG